MVKPLKNHKEHQYWNLGNNYMILNIDISISIQQSYDYICTLNAGYNTKLNTSLMFHWLDIWLNQ